MEQTHENHKTQTVSEYLVNKLAEKFGSAMVRINTPHHIQVILPRTELRHNFWINRFFHIKYQFAGQRESHGIGSGHKAVDRVIRIVSDYKFEHTDMGRMSEALALTNFIVDVTALPRQGRVIYCDAGWKDGIGQISAVLIDDDFMRAESRKSKFTNRSNSIGKFIG